MSFAFANDTQFYFVRTFLLAIFGAWAIGFLQCVHAQNVGPLKVTLHDSNGLTSASAPDHHLELILFKSHTHMHVRISNKLDQALSLWCPYCPEGDESIIVEFRDPNSPSNVYRARPGWVYTAGMGLPKSFVLAAHDDLIVNLDFTSDIGWGLPMRAPKDAIREMEVRVGYRSRNLSDKQRSGYGDYKIGTVWEGEVIGNWEKISVINRSERAIGRDK